MRRSNGISIEDVLKMDCMKKCKLIAGFGGVRNTVSNVNIMADPDILNWVEAGELLLTTAYSFKQDEIEEQKRLVSKSAEMGLAGIGIKLQPYLKNLHPEIIEMANSKNFPIIELHDSMPFSEIMTPIFQEIFNKQASLLKRIEKIHEQLMNVMLEGGGIREVLHVVSENIQNPVLVSMMETDETLVEFEQVSDEMRRLLMENAQRFLKQAKRKGEENRFIESEVSLENKQIRRMIMPLLVKNQVAGYLMAWSVETPLGGFDLSVIESASTTMALEILRQMSVRDVENRYRAEFFEDLISMDEKRKEKALEKAGRFKLNRNDYYIVVVLQLVRLEADLSDNLIHKMNWLTRETELFVRDHFVQTLLVGKTDSLHILFSDSGEENVKEIVDIFGQYMNLKKHDYPVGIDFRIGIGRCYTDLQNAGESYVDAIRAIQHGPLVEEHELAYFERLGIYKILCQPSLQDELLKFYKGTIQPLVEYDEKKSTELVRTLECYYEQSGNLRKTADSLFTHYNTTLYRMESIQRITGMQLSNHKDRLNLEVALKIKKLLHK